MRVSRALFFYENFQIYFKFYFFKINTIILTIHFERLITVLPKFVTSYILECVIVRIQ